MGSLKVGDFVCSVYRKGNLCELDGSKSDVGEAIKQGDRAVRSTVRDREKSDSEVSGVSLTETDFAFSMLRAL